MTCMATARSARTLTMLVLLAALPATAFASGFSVARFGGAHGNPTEYNPYSIYYNPAGVAGVDGYQLNLDVNWAWRNATYERPDSAVDSLDSQSEDALAANTGTGEVSNFIYSPMLGFASDFNTDIPFGIGFAFFAPFGGQSVWDESGPDSTVYPGAFDGAQRWYVTEGTIRTLAFSLAGAYEIETIRLSIGLAANLYLSEIDTIRARNATGTDGLSGEGRSWLDVSSTDLGAGIGVLWETVEDTFWIGASYQTAPAFNGEQVFEGDLTVVTPTGDGEPDDVTVTAQLPDILRLGFRYRPIEDLELRLFGDLTRWSRLQQHCIIGTSSLEGNDPYDHCADKPDGTLETEENVVIQNLVRRWDDAVGFRLGGSYWLSDAIELQLDVGYDMNAIPDEVLEPALMDFSKATIGAGGRFRLVDSVHFGLLATNVFYFERDTTDAGTAEDLRAPSRQPSSEGVYTQNVFLINTNFEFAF